MTIQDWVAAAHNRSFVFDDLNRLVSSTSATRTGRERMKRMTRIALLISLNINFGGELYPV